MPLQTAQTYDLLDRDVVLSEFDASYTLRVKDLPGNEKPREKLTQLGPNNLSVAELVAILWGVGSKKEEVLVMARRIMKEYGEKAIAAETNPAKLAEALDIPLSKACQIVAGFELGRRFFASQAGRPVFIRNAKQAYQYFRGMGSSKKEQLRGLYLNSRYQVIYDELISVGSLTSNVVHPREVFQPAVEHGAVAVVIAHNHPSGSLLPTAADIEVTQQLIAAGQVMGIELLDHLIIGNNKFVSIIKKG